MPEKEYIDRCRIEQQGYDDYCRGEVICPYKGKSRSYFKWRAGWLDAERILSIPIFPSNYQEKQYGRDC